MPLIRAFLCGCVAGLRSMTAPAVVSQAARCGKLDLGETPLAFMACDKTALVLTIMAAGELVADKLPIIPDRRKPPSFAFRIASGGLAGAAIGVSQTGASQDALLPGLLCGAAGAVLGTLGGAAARARLAEAFGCDLPAALVEDATAVGLGVAATQRWS